MPCAVSTRIGKDASKAALGHPPSLPQCLEGKINIREDTYCLFTTGTDFENLLWAWLPHPDSSAMLHLPSLSPLLSFFLLVSSQMLWRWFMHLQIKSCTKTQRYLLELQTFQDTEWMNTNNPGIWSHKPQPFASTCQGCSRPSHQKKKSNRGKNPPIFHFPILILKHRFNAQMYCKIRLLVTTISPHTRSKTEARRNVYTPCHKATSADYKHMFQQQKEIQVVISRVAYTTFYKHLLKPFEMKC